jgi:hypothetical protein
MVALEERPTGLAIGVGRWLRQTLFVRRAGVSLRWLPHWLAGALAGWARRGWEESPVEEVWARVRHAPPDAFARMDPWRALLRAVG